ncbi:MAG: tetratricopeptide repeat protein [Phycisphaerae bacterium]|nr:tetratricopeptide repeat protein [Phycisphaerae bacterium]
MLNSKSIVVLLVLLVAVASPARLGDDAQLGNAAFEKGDFQEAVERYEQALRAKPSFGVYVNLGHCHTQLKNWSQAENAYEAAIELESESATPELWRFLGQARYNSGRFEQAMKAFFEAASLKPNDRDSIWIVRCMIELEQWIQGQAVLLRHLQRKPKDIEALEMLAYVIGRQDNLPGVIDVYRQLLTAAPRRTEYRIALTNVLAAAGRAKEAIDTLEFARRVDKGLGERTNRLLADLYLAERMPQEAAACYARLVAILDDPSSEDYYRLGAAYFQTGEPASAENAFKRMRQAAPTDFKADLYLGHIAAERDSFDKAKLHYQAAIEKNPSSAETFVALADLQMKNRHYSDAAVHFAEAIALGDNRPQVHYNHILALMHQADSDLAKAAIKTALAEHPSDKQLTRLLDQYVEQTAPGSANNQ